MVRRYQDWYKHFRLMSPRLVRLFACHCFDYCKDRIGEDEKVVSLVECGRKYADWGEAYAGSEPAPTIPRRTLEQCLAAFQLDKERVLAIQGYPMYQREFPVELAEQILTTKIDKDKVMLAVFGIRTYANEFDRQLLEDFDVIGGGQKLRESFGVLPFRDPEISIARKIYDEGDHPAIPILADALDDNDYIPKVMCEHLRNGKPHWKGCWVIDEILGGK